MKAIKIKFLQKLTRRWQAYLRLKVGRKGETLACRFLQKQGYFIWKRNWRCRHGELDIVAYNNKVLRFIEVKTRLGPSALSFPALDAIDKEKSRRLERLAHTFVLRHRKAMRLRRLTSVAIDAITIVQLDRRFAAPEILHIENFGDEFNYDGRKELFIRK